MWLITAAMLPPAESPPTATRSGSAPSDSALATAHSNAAKRVFERLGEGVLRGEAVVDREHPHAGGRGEQSADARRGCRGRRSPSRRRGSRRAAAPARRRARARRRRGAPASGRAARGSSSRRTSAIGSGGRRAGPSPRSATGRAPRSTLRPAKKPSLPDQRARVRSAWVSLESVWPSIGGGLPKIGAAGPRREPAGPLEDGVLHRYRQSRQLLRHLRRLFHVTPICATNVTPSC